MPRWRENQKASGCHILIYNVMGYCNGYLHLPPPQAETGLSSIRNFQVLSSFFVHKGTDLFAFHHIFTPHFSFLFNRIPRFPTQVSHYPLPFYSFLTPSASTLGEVLEYSPRNTPVLLWKYSSTASRVLEYCPESTRVLSLKYSPTPKASVKRPFHPILTK